MCTLKLPIKIIEHIDQARRHCLWRKSADFGVKHNSLTAWDNGMQTQSMRGELASLNSKSKTRGGFSSICISFITSLLPENMIPRDKPQVGLFWWRDVIDPNDIFRGITSCAIGTRKSTFMWKDA